MEKLSVIVPVYNTYPYLRQCLESIINQTYKNLEIIIVNDASPYIEDDEICKEYAEKDKRIIYIKHDTNKSQGGARNTGIKAATGKYITFVDSDDYLHDLKGYEDVITIMEKNSYNHAILDHKILELDGTAKYVPIINKYYKKNKKINPKRIMNVTVFNKIYLTKELQDNNIYFEENMKYEDGPFTYKYILAINPNVIHTGKSMYMYRMQNESTTHNPKNLLDVPKSHQLIYDNIKEHGKEEEYTENIIKQFNWFNNGVWGLNKEDLKKYTKEYKDFMKNSNITPDKIRKYGDISYILQFIEDDEIRKMCQEILAPFKEIDNKIIPENKYIYKIKREIKRIIKQINMVLKFKN